MNTTAKAEIVNHVRLTIELSKTHAAELAGLLGGHVSFLDFPWAGAIYNALDRAGIQEEFVFTDTKLGEDIFFERTQAADEEDE